MVSLKGLLTACACVLIAGTYVLASYDVFEPSPPPSDPEMMSGLRGMAAIGHGDTRLRESMSDTDVVGSTLRTKPIEQHSGEVNGYPGLDAFGADPKPPRKPAAPVEFPGAIFD